MDMLITKRFKYAVKKVCEMLGVYPPKGGTTNPKLTVQVINNSDFNVYFDDVYKMVDGYIVFGPPVPYSLEPGETESIETIIISYPSDEGELVESLFDGDSYPTYAFKYGIYSEGSYEINASDAINCVENGGYVYLIDVDKDASITITVSGLEPN